MRTFRQGNHNPDLIYLDEMVLERLTPRGTPGNYVPLGKGIRVLDVAARALDPDLAAEFAKRVCLALNAACWACPPGCDSCPGLRTSCECYEHPNGKDLIEEWVDRS